jgi:hypothetical protein
MVQIINILQNISLQPFLFLFAEIIAFEKKNNRAWK